MSMTVEHKMMTLLQVIISKDPTLDVLSSSIYYKITNMNPQMISKLLGRNMYFKVHIQSSLMILQIT